MKTYGLLKYASELWYMQMCYVFYCKLKKILHFCFSIIAVPAKLLLRELRFAHLKFHSFK